MKVSYNSNDGLDLKPTQPEDQTLIDRIAKHVVNGRRYYLRDKMTPGLGYDDRLQERLGLSKNTVRKYVDNGRLQAVKLDGKIMMCEAAVMRFMDPMGFAVENEASNLKAA